MLIKKRVRLFVSWQVAGESILNEFMGFKIYSHTGLTGYFEAGIDLVSSNEPIKSIGEIIGIG